MNWHFISIPRPRMSWSLRARQNLIRCFSPRRKASSVRTRIGFLLLIFQSSLCNSCSRRFRGCRPETSSCFSRCFRDGAGQPFVPHEVVERVSSAASVPVYGFLDQYLGRGIVGGSLYSFTAHGDEAARMVLRTPGGRAARPARFRDLKQQDHFRLAPDAPLGHQRAPSAFREPNRVPGINPMGTVLVANRVRWRSCSGPGRVDLGTAARTWQAPPGGGAGAAAHGRTCPYQPFLNGWRTHRHNRPRNQSAAWGNSCEC